MTNTLKHETIFYGISKYANVLVTILTTGILSRILSPSEYGVVTVVTVFTAFFAVLSDMGLGTAVIQNKTLSEEETDDIFSFSIYMAIGLCAVFAILGVPISAFYGNTEYIKICGILSISILLNTANIVPNAELMKRKRFRSVGKRLICASVFSGVAAILLAFAGFSYYSIVFQSVLQSAFIFVWNMLKTKLRFKLIFSMSSIKKVRQYSTYQFLYSFLNYFARNLDNLLIGKTLGSVSLAYYDKGYRLMMYPVQNLTYVINPIIHPILSEHQNDKAYVFSAYLQIARVLSVLGVLISGICYLCSEEIIMIFFGKQWHESIPIFRLLCISVWPQLVSSSAGSIYQSLGNTELMFKSGAIHFSVAIACIISGVIIGDLQAVALLVTIGLYLRFLIDFFFLIVKGFQYPYLRFLWEFRWDFLIAVLLSVAICFMKTITIESLLLCLIVKASVLCLIYIIALLITGQMKVFYSIIRRD